MNNGLACSSGSLFPHPSNLAQVGAFATLELAETYAETAREILSDSFPGSIVLVERAPFFRVAYDVLVYFVFLQDDDPDPDPLTYAINFLNAEILVNLLSFKTQNT